MAMYRLVWVLAINPIVEILFVICIYIYVTGA